MDQIQKGYYGYQHVPQVLMQRLEAIRAVMPTGSRLIDIGCNDGTISNVFLRSGYAVRSTGIDFEDIRQDPAPGFAFIAADLRTFDLSTLPQVDMILCLNVVHHLCLHGIDFARAFMRQLAGKAGVVICDMGSLDASIGEHLDAAWLQALKAEWNSDEACWADLFEPFAWRRPLLTYPFQSAHRLLWKLAGSLEAAYQYEEIEQGQVPVRQPAWRIVKRPGTDELFRVSQQQTALSTAERQLYDFLRHCPFTCEVPVVQNTVPGPVYAYDRETALAEPVTAQKATECFPAEDCAKIGQFSQQAVPSLGNRRLAELCEFKTVRTVRGLTFLDFALRP